MEKYVISFIGVNNIIPINQSINAIIQEKENEGERDRHIKKKTTTKFYILLINIAKKTQNTSSSKKTK